MPQPLSMTEIMWKPSTLWRVDNHKAWKQNLILLQAFQSVKGTVLLTRFSQMIQNSLL